MFSVMQTEGEFEMALSQTELGSNTRSGLFHITRVN